MATKIITKNSSTATSIPTAGDLVQGELAVNVTDKRLFTEDSGGAIVELGTNPSTLTSGAATFRGLVTFTGGLVANTADINAGTIDGTVIGGAVRAAGSFTTLAASGASTLLGATITTVSGIDMVALNGDTSFTGTSGIGSTGTGGDLIHFSPSGYGHKWRTNNVTNMILDASGNLGVGVTPTSKLHLYEAGAGDGTIKVGNVQDIYTANYGKQGATAYGATSAGAAFVYTFNNDISIMSDGTTGVIKFTTGGNAERMRLDASGNVGIGTSSPSVRVDSHDNGVGLRATRLSNTDQYIEMQGGDGAGLSHINANYQMAFKTGNTERMRIDANGTITQTTSSASPVSANFVTGNSNCDITMNSANTSSLTRLRNGTNDFQVHTNGSEAMRIDASGNLLVGQTSQNQATVGSSITPAGVISTAVANGTSGANNYHLYSTDASAYRFYVGMHGTVFATSTTISAISDIRYKENIRDLDDGLSKIMALQPRKFDWKEGKGRDVKDDRGWIAQEIETVFPDLVDEWKDEAPEGEEPYKSVRPDLIPVLVKAIQEQQATIESLTARIAALEGA